MANPKILSAAKDLFFKFGLKKVTVEEICAAAGMSKMTFYRAFKNKAEVAERVIDQLIEQGEQEYQEVMEGTAPFPKKLKQLLELKYSNTQNISEAFIKDLYAKDQALAAKLSQAQSRQMERIKQDFAKAQKEGWINPELSMDFILYMLNDLNAKMKDEQLLKMYTHPSKLIQHLTQYFFSGIANTKKQP